MQTTAHANTPLPQMLIERLCMTPEDATWWDDATAWSVGDPEADIEMRFEGVQDWVRRFPPETAKDWYLGMAAPDEAEEWEAAGFAPIQVDEVLTHTWDQCGGDGPGTYEALLREQAWRESGLSPREVLSRLRNGQERPE